MKSIHPDDGFEARRAIHDEFRGNLTNKPAAALPNITGKTSEFLT